VPPEQLIARKQTSPEGLMAKLDFLKRQIGFSDDCSWDLAESCRMDAEVILDIIPF
jgi:hypothetical protein